MTDRDLAAFNQESGAVAGGASRGRVRATRPTAPGNAATRRDWGEYQGRKRKPCPEDPLMLAGQPIGQYHCPYCGMMVLAGIPHLSPSAPENQDPSYWMGDYEEEYGQPWPLGYEEAA